MDRRKHRPHLPHELGPRVYRAGRFWKCDLRPWGGGRVAVRNPKDPGWPDAGERTEDEAVARKWAWSHLEYVMGETRDRQLGKAKGKPLRTTLDAYREHQRRTLAPTTYTTARAPLQALLEAFGDVPITKVRPEKLQKMLDALSDAGFRPRTVEFQKKTWSRFFNWAGDYNPAKDLTLPNMSEAEVIHAWSYEQWMRVRKRAKKSRSHIPILRIIDFCVCTGGRINEVLALRYEDFNPKAGTVRIARQFEPGYTTLRGPKGSGRKVRARTALVHPELWEWYRFKGTGYVLTHEGEPINSKRATEVLKPILSNVKGVGGHRRAFHDCRRTYIRLWVERGAYMAEVQRWVGHSSIVTTEKAYPAFSSEQAAENAMRRIRDLQNRRA